MGEKAVLTVLAHVFQIDPDTKKKWLPTSTASVKVSYYHDPTRRTYRIIAIEDKKPLINSTVTANMTFTKTSPKFGQWSDHRANTVYGLGFGSEKDQSLFSDKFTEAKTAARKLLEERKKTKTTASADTSKVTTSLEGEKEDVVDVPPLSSPSSVASTSPPAVVTTPIPVTTAIVSPTKPISNGNASTEETDKQIESLKFENNKLKVALASSAQNVKKWESEMQTLRNNNAMLTTALEESTQHVAEWKRQLQKYKEECDSLRKKMGEHDMNPAAVESMKQENEELKEVLSAVQVDLEEKTEECSKKAQLVLESEQKLASITSEKNELTAKLKQLDTKMKQKEEYFEKKSSTVQKKHKEMQSQLTSILSLQTELSMEFSS